MEIDEVYSSELVLVEWEEGVMTHKSVGFVVESTDNAIIIAQNVALGRDDVDAGTFAAYVYENYLNCDALAMTGILLIPGRRVRKIKRLEM